MKHASMKCDNIFIPLGTIHEFDLK